MPAHIEANMGGAWLWPLLLSVVLAAPVATVGVAGGFELGPGALLIGRTFLSESITEDGAPHPLLGRTRIDLTFHDDARISAWAGCNHMGAPVEIKGGRIVVGKMVSTLIGCGSEQSAQDEWLAALLRDHPAFTLDGDRLQLRSKGTVIELLDRRVADPDRPLEGTVWRFGSIFEGGTVSTVPGTATVRFAGGRVTVNVEDCNDGGADVEIGPSKLRVGTLAMTEQACTSTAADIEAALVAVLHGDVDYAIEGGSLTLTNPTGKGLGLGAEG